ncbi:tRNA-dihydrouridine synthase DusB [hydrothermal vent metagenome]|uniref:tRNA-dihydrouridine synthase DusB n=1 Tax=hydrothermal vent metagenome TaxID=652676 RepID=A0A3B1DHL8_9ZZZZ
MNIGPIHFDTPPLALAPMEDVSDMAFRLICKQLGADLLYTEFTSSEALIRDIPTALDRVLLSDQERPIGIQIFGANPQAMAESVKCIEKFKPDFIDINAGCWSKNHVNRGECAALLKDLPRFEQIVKAVVNATKLPVTVKTRLGWDANSIVIPEVAKMVEDCGAKALTVHCRTRSQGYKGNANWDWLGEIKKNINIPLIGNGDVTSPQDAKRMLEMGCDGVMIGRGAISNPWIFKQTKYYLKTEQLLPEPTLEEKIDLCIYHLNLFIKLRQETQRAVFAFRKYYIGYLKGIANVGKLRAKIMKTSEVDEVIELLEKFKKEN